MSPALITALCLCVLYVIGREVEHYERNRRILTPSKCEHFLPDDESADVEMDSWAELWQAAYEEDALERWWAMEAREPTA
jgi:hypothetical protein